MEKDFTYLSNKQMNMIIKGYNRLKKVKIEKHRNSCIPPSDATIQQYHEINVINNDYSNTQHWLMKE